MNAHQTSKTYSSGRYQAGFIASWAALAVLIVGLMLTGSATYLITQHYQNTAYSAFIQEAGFLHRQLEKTLESSRFHAQLAAEFTLNQPASMDLLMERAREIKSIELIQTSPLGPVAISLPQTLANLEPQSSYLKEELSQDRLLGVLTEHSPQMLSPHYNKQALKAGQAETVYLIPKGENVLSIGIDLGILLQEVREQARIQGVSVNLYDLERFSSDPFLTLNPEPVSQNNPLADDRRWQYQNTFALPDADWMLRMTPTIKFQRRFDSQMALIVFASGTLISLLLALLSSLLIQRQSHEASRRQRQANY
ncbi:hypothetical protein [Hahella ganghwensis]|uniref:hypothetical protein n=1 Tax=Hahella ganghwensis TaxID=286420 RepID=UPI00035D9B1D|nr:hypothetical protein [Hahella ganghwensis]